MYCLSFHILSLVNMSETQISMLQKAANRTMKVILHCDKHTKIDHTLQTLQFASIKQRLYYSVCVFIYKTLNNMLPGSLRNKFVIVENEKQRLTRQTGKLRVHRKACFIKRVKTYNSSPVRIKQCDVTFKRELTEHFKYAR